MGRLAGFSTISLDSASVFWALATRAVEINRLIVKIKR